MTPSMLDTQVLRGCEYIGIDVKTMHKIRKTYGSTLFNNGVALTTVKDLLGHADEATTMRYYIFDTSGDAERTNQILTALNVDDLEKATT